MTFDLSSLRPRLSRLIPITTALACVLALLTSPSAHAVSAAPRPYPPSPATNALGDATGDGLADIWAIIGPTRWHYSNTRNNDTDFFETGTTFLRLRGTVMGDELGPATAFLPTIDWNGDRRADFLVRLQGQMYLYYNLGDGYLRKGPQVGQNWGGMDQVLYAGRLNGDNMHYVLAREAGSGKLFAYRMLSGGRLSSVGQVGHGWQGMRFILAPGNIVGDSKADLVAIDGNGDMWCYRGAGLGKIYKVGRCGTGWNNYAAAFIPGDMDGDGRWDLVGVKALTNPTSSGTPSGGNSAPISEKSPLYVYRNLGTGWWGKGKLMGYDMYQYNVFG